MDRIDDLPTDHTTILCDLWGCVHDGRALFPGVLERLGQWRTEGRRVLFITNAPRSGAAIQRQLDTLGLPRELYDGIVTAGDTGAARLAGRPVGFLGTAADRRDLEGRGLVLIDEGFAELACAGIDETRSHVRDFLGELGEWRRHDVLLHCLNPDRIVHQAGVPIVCAGAICDAYEAMGGRVMWYGKPHPEIYAAAMDLAGRPDRSSVVAIGDGLQTDALGAAHSDIPFVFVTSGIHAGQDFPADFGAGEGLEGWRPMMIVDGLA